MEGLYRGAWWKVGWVVILFEVASVGPPEKMEVMEIIIFFGFMPKLWHSSDENNYLVEMSNHLNRFETEFLNNFSVQICFLRFAEKQS